MSSNRMILAKSAAQIAAEEAATYGTSYGLLRGLTAYAPDFLKTVSGYGQSYFGPVMPVLDATISTLVRIPGDVYNKSAVLANAGKNIASGIAAAYIVNSIRNASGVNDVEMDPNLGQVVRVAIEATATSLTARALRFASEKAATRFGLFNKPTVNNADGFQALLNDADLNNTQQGDLEAQQQTTAPATAPVPTSPRLG